MKHCRTSSKMTAEMIVEAVFMKLKLSFVPEYRFHEKRKWRFDYFLPSLNTAIEIEGGIFSGGRHTRGAGYSRDCEKYNQAQVLGFRVLRYPAHELRKSCAGLIEDLEKIEKLGEIAMENKIVREDDFLDDFLAGFSRAQFQDDEILRLVKKNGEIVHIRKKKEAGITTEEILKIYEEGE